MTGWVATHYSQCPTQLAMIDDWSQYAVELQGSVMFLYSPVTTHASHE
jgi:hypothetical protein